LPVRSVGCGFFNRRQVERLNASQTNATTTAISPVQPGSK
jgi:hypothetical protein